jgi:hypothetical protein
MSNIKCPALRKREQKPNQRAEWSRDEQSSQTDRHPRHGRCALWPIEIHLISLSKHGQKQGRCANHKYWVPLSWLMCVSAAPLGLATCTWRRFTKVLVSSGPFDSFPNLLGHVQSYDRYSLAPSFWDALCSLVCLSLAVPYSVLLLAVGWRTLAASRWKLSQKDKCHMASLRWGLKKLIY